jgi:hypothetical protein
MIEEEKVEEYSKKITLGMSDMPDGDIDFYVQRYRKQKRLRMNTDESERVGIIDINKYPILIVKEKAKRCHDILKDGVLSHKVFLTKRRFNTALSSFYDICPEYENSFSSFMRNEKWIRSPRFHKVTPAQIKFIRDLFHNEHTIHLPLDLKRLMLLEAFPENPLSRSTVYNIQRKLLNFTFKRITKYRTRSHNSYKQKLRRLFFIKTYIEKLDDPEYKIVIIDEAGFGTKNQRLRNYGYALKGKEVLFAANHIAHNISAVAAMS